MKHTLLKITPLLIIFTVLLSSNFIDAAFTIPAGTPSAANNAPAPINTSAQNQIKSGDITARHLNAGSLVRAGWQMRSPRYCDQNGKNCVSATNLKSGISLRKTRHVYESVRKESLSRSVSLGKKDFCAITGIMQKSDYKDGDNVSCRVRPSGGGNWRLEYYKNKYINWYRCEVTCLGDGGSKSWFRGI